MVTRSASSFSMCEQFRKTHSCCQLAWSIPAGQISCLSTVPESPQYNKDLPYFIGSATGSNDRCPAVLVQRRLASSDDNARLSGGRRYAAVTPWLTCLSRRRLRLPVMAMASTAEHPVA